MDRGGSTSPNIQRNGNNAEVCWLGDLKMYESLLVIFSKEVSKAGSAGDKESLHSCRNSSACLPSCLCPFDNNVTLGFE